MGILRGVKDEIIVTCTAEIEGSKIKFSATFRRRDWLEASKIANSISSALDRDAPDGWELMTSTVRNDLVSWKNLQGEGGEVEFNPENLEQALNVYGYLSALYRGWNMAQTNQSGVNAKN